MNVIKKGLLTFGVTAALTGAFAVANPTNVEAAEWEARTVEEVREDIQSNGVESRYTIQWGDTLGTIADALDIPVNQIVHVNEIANRDLIIAGNTLHLSTESETISIEEQAVEETQSSKAEAPAEEAAAPAEEAKEATTTEETATEAPAESSNATSADTTSGSEAEAKAWIAFKESTDNYNARNGQYIGKYQLSESYLNGDHSPENQERVADEYVASRYGSWTAAKEFWLKNGWY